MVKGVSKQVIVLHAPEPKLFEQAIFILKEDALRNGGVTDDVLLKEARRLISEQKSGRSRKLSLYGPVWACGGALIMALVWGLSALI